MVILKIQPSLRAYQVQVERRLLRLQCRRLWCCAKELGDPRIESRFQRLIGSAIEFLGRCPRLQVIPAPLALGAYRARLPIGIATGRSAERIAVRVPLPANLASNFRDSFLSDRFLVLRWS
jgi:hypothetical protein